MKVLKSDGELARMRKERGLTQEAAARRIGVDHSQVSRYEDGSMMPSFPTFRRMCAVYGVTADALVAAFVAVERRRNGRAARGAVA